jgi:hypothetical protein
MSTVAVDASFAEERRASETRRIWIAMMLAPELETCRALLRGERVPVDRLDPTWLERFGRRTA